jgi:phage shock protein PspC (stress-responsive transcriptional regulator)
MKGIIMKRPYRSRKEKMLAGVAGGLAEYFDIDPVIARIIFVVTTVISGIGLLAYILLWIIVPWNPEDFHDFNCSRYTPAPGPGNEETGNPEQTDPASRPDAASAEADNTQTDADTVLKKKNKNLVAGSILIAIGVLFLADNFLPFFRFSDFWPLVFVALGIGLILKNK